MVRQVAVAVAGFALLAAASVLPAAELALNDVQMLGSHNSYKQAMAPERMDALAEADPALARALDYQHPPLAAQLELGVRKLELDVFYDPGGRLFGRARSASGGESAFPVLHVQNLDDRSHCANLLDCLAAIREWSDANAGHLPLFLSFNAKDAVIDRPGFLRPLPFGEDAWLALDAELRAGLGARLLTPAAVFSDGALTWPGLDAARGRVIAVLDEGGDKRRQYASRWRERAMFATVPPGEPGAAIVIVNDPVAEFERIRGLVRSGYIVRTRADADTAEARRGDTARRDAAWASGAQLVSTDYYLPGGYPDTGYRVTVPGGGVARCNPVRIPQPCRLPRQPAQD
ncbi:MAG: hypothetical protein CMD39_10600 [Gammaproteobacteria bacterium]|nr:hypothetical protein [Gammaproteobacteria bacterium]